MPRYRVEIAFWEPTYARHSGRPPRIYRSEFEVRAANREAAKEEALRHFHALEKASSVGWSRRIVSVTVEKVGEKRSREDPSP